jgi:two-component system, NarL family, nitrate/nitrite response regulator NarL
MTELLLVEDHAAFREALAFMLDREPDFTVVAQAATAAQAAAVDRSWDIALADLSLPDGGGAPLVEALAERGTVVVLTASASAGEHAAAYEAGAAGVVSKAAAMSEIIDVLRAVASGESLVDPAELVEILREARRYRQQRRESEELKQRLTPREREVLQALADGKSNREIADALFISVETQRTHMVNILNKLGAHSQLQALVVAVRNGIVSVE